MNIKINAEKIYNVGRYRFYHKMQIFLFSRPPRNRRRFVFVGRSIARRSGQNPATLLSFTVCGGRFLVNAKATYETENE